MNKQEIEEFQLWLSGQPDHTTYSQAKDFLSTYLGVNKSKAEVELMKLQKNEDIKIIKTEKTKPRPVKRVFTKPLKNLTESDIRSVWGGSPHSERQLSMMISSIQDRTGHEPKDINGFIKELCNEGKAAVEGGRFRWLE